MLRLLGILIFTLGIGLAGWIAYNLLILRTPYAQGRNPTLPIVMSVLWVYVGYKWMRGKRGE